MKSQSSQYRMQICGLPPKLAFSPSSASTPCIDDSTDDESLYQKQEIILWKKQLREEELWKDAQSNTKMLLREIISFHHGQKDGGSPSLADDLIQYFGRGIVPSTSNYDSTEDVNNAQHYFDTWLTIHDLEKMSQILQDHFSADGLINEFVQNSKDTSVVKRNFQEKAVSSHMSWHQLIIMPYEGAASAILKIYDQDASKQHMRQYLNYRAIRTIEQVQYFTLPFQKKQRLHLEQYYCKQQQLKNDLELCYNDAFDKLDDYCMNILGGLASDTLPLFPEQPVEFDDNGDATSKVIDEYSDQVARHVQNIMMDELQKISKRLLSFLEDNRQAISTALEYYLQFTDFLSSAKWRDREDSGCYKRDDEVMPTLKQFVTSSSDTLISQFIHSPSTRTKLVIDLQQLDSFLNSRKRELSSRVSGGRDVVEAIDLAWTQHRITTASKTPGGNFLSDVTLDDMSQYTSAIQNVLAQIVEDGFHAKRLRLLADVLGCSPTEEEALRFKILCRRAACLAYQMSLYQSQQETSALITERCKFELEMKDEAIRLDMCRLDVVTTMSIKY